MLVAAERLAAADRLWVGHWPTPPAVAVAVPGAFVLDTCLRRCVVTLGEHPALAAPQCFAGRHAYQFLLEVATGLRSAIPGETNVFGQLRRAALDPVARAAMTPDLALLIERLIADTRAIRAEHLDGIGGASYGTLVRRLLRPAPGTAVLLIGAGNLARSLLPFLRHCRLGICSRSPPGADFAPADRRFAASEAATAAAWAAQVILTTPADDAHDRRWSACLDDGKPRPLVHLGRRRHEPVSWPGNVRAYDLDDVFDLRRTQDNIRSLQIERARQACHERALRLAAAATPAAATVAARCAAG
jgi:hypothetical protein